MDSRNEKFNEYRYAFAKLNGKIERFSEKSEDRSSLGSALRSRTNTPNSPA